jgi:hypothetical protein
LAIDPPERELDWRDLLVLDLPEFDLLRELVLDFDRRELPLALVGAGERPFDRLLELEFLLVFVCAISPSFQAAWTQTGLPTAPFPAGTQLTAL